MNIKNFFSRKKNNIAIEPKYYIKKIIIYVYYNTNHDSKIYTLLKHTLKETTLDKLDKLVDETKENYRNIINKAYEELNNDSKYIKLEIFGNFFLIKKDNFQRLLITNEE